jgi:hypothetical protein
LQRVTVLEEKVERLQAEFEKVQEKQVRLNPKP